MKQRVFGREFSKMVVGLFKVLAMEDLDHGGGIEMMTECLKGFGYVEGNIWRLV